MADCIPIETLLRWLADEIPLAEADTVNDHVAVCSRCQSLLDHETEHARPARLSRCQAAGKGLKQCRSDPERTSWTGFGPRCRSKRTRLTGRSGPRIRARQARTASSTGLGTIGSFLLLDELGRGGMGIVFRAWDKPLQRIVALKVLRRELADDVDRLNLVREAAARSQLPQRSRGDDPCGGQSRGRSTLPGDGVRRGANPGRIDRRRKNGPSPSPGCESGRTGRLWRSRPLTPPA